MKLRDAFLRAIQQVNSYGASSLLQDVPWRQIGGIDAAASHDSYLARRRNQAFELCKTVARDLENYGAQQQLAQLIGEMRIYAALKSHVPVQSVPESHESTPDFRVGVGRKPLYAEAKVLMPAAVANHQRHEMQESLNWRAAVEGKRGLHFRESVQSFYERPGKAYDPSSPKVIAEVLIEKIQQNVKGEQFARGQTILIVSLEYLVTLVPPQLAIKREFRDRDTNSIANGELWLAAAGRIGEQAVRAPACSGDNPTPESVEKEGVLWAYPFVSGIAYFMGGRFYSVVDRRRLNGRNAVLINLFSRVVVGTG